MMHSGELFLPFTVSGKITEKQAVKVKRYLGLGPYSSVDPAAVLPDVPAKLLPPDVFDCFEAEDRHILLDRGADDWSALCAGESPLTGEYLIVLNPRHHPHRQKASLMEEVVHLVLGHPPTRLVQEANGRWRRTHDGDVEDEAYCVGAACIIPYRSLFNQIQDGGITTAEIAAMFGVSKQYVQYRIKRAGLTAMFRKRCGPLEDVHLG